MQTLSIPDSTFTEFKTKANAAAGAEVCAVLTGNITEATIDEVRMIKNVAEKVDRAFIMDPVEFLEAVMDTDLYDIAFTTHYMGIIHSHYFDRAFPSIADWNGAVGGLYHGYYLIYSVLHEELNAFYWNGNEFLKTELV